MEDKIDLNKPINEISLYEKKVLIAVLLIKKKAKENREAKEKNNVSLNNENQKEKE
jgi:hypothetical protein